MTIAGQLRSDHQVAKEPQVAPWVGTIVAAMLLLALLLLIHPLPHLWILTIAMIVSIVAPLLASVLCFAGPSLAGAEAVQRRVVLLGGIGFVFSALESVVYGEEFVSSVLVKHTTFRFPVLAGVLVLAAYLCLLVAAFTLVSYPQTWHERVRLLLDSLLLVAGVAGYSWYYVLGPSLLTAHVPTTNLVLAAIFPLCDLLLFVPIVLLWFSPVQVGSQQVLHLVWLALALSLVGDSITSLLGIAATQGFGDVPSVTSPGAQLLAALGIHYLRGVRVGQLSDEAHLPSALSWQRIVLPYLVIPFMVFLGLHSRSAAGASALTSGVAVDLVLIGILLLLRQTMALLENRQLYGLLRQHAQALTVANRRLETLATTDPLTGLDNHRALATGLEAALAHTRRTGHACSLLFLDLDHFKEINDRWGHLTGDAVLVEFAEVARAALRQDTLLGRWGGEEFVALLQEAGPVEGLAAAQRLCRTVAGHGFVAMRGMHASCSIGVATAPDDGDGATALLNCADSALYRAKQAGRNCVRAGRIDGSTQLISS